MTEELKKRVEESLAAMRPFHAKIEELSAQETAAKKAFSKRAEELKKAYDDGMAEATIQLDKEIQAISKEMTELTLSNDYNFARLELREAEEDLIQFRVAEKRAKRVKT